MSQSRLTLVWSNHLANEPAKEGRVSKQKPLESPPISSAWERLGNHPVYKIATPFIAIIIAILSVVYSAGWRGGSIESELKNLDTRVFGSDGLKVEFSKLTDQSREMGQRLSRLEGKIDGLLTNIYRQNARMLGFQNPQVFPVSLSKPQEYRPSGGVSYDLTYRILEIGEKHLTVSISGTVGTNKLQDNRTVIPYQINVPVEVGGFRFPGMPRLFIAILDFPDEETAIVAFGPRTTPAS